MRKIILSIHITTGDEPEHIHSHSNHAMAICSAEELKLATIVGIRRIGNRFFMDQWQPATGTQRTTMVKKTPVDTMKQMKQLPGNDILLFGNSIITAQLLSAGIADEYRFIVPALQPDVDISTVAAMALQHKLQHCRTLLHDDGTTVLHYHPVSTVM